MYSCAPGFVALTVTGTVAAFSVEAGICLATGLAFSSAASGLVLLSGNGAAFSLAATTGAGAGSTCGVAVATAGDLYNRSMNPELSNSFINERSTNCSGRAERAFGSLTPISRRIIWIPFMVG